MNKKIYEALKDEPNVDMVIIKKPLEENIEWDAWLQYNREYALEKEAKFFWDEGNE